MSESSQILAGGIVLLLALIPVVHYSSIMFESNLILVILATLVAISLLSLFLLTAKVFFKSRYQQRKQAAMLAAAIRDQLAL